MNDFKNSITFSTELLGITEKIKKAHLMQRYYADLLH